jgi:hypothetical protein
VFEEVNSGAEKIEAAIAKPEPSASASATASATAKRAVKTVIPNLESVLVAPVLHMLFVLEAATADLFLSCRQKTRGHSVHIVGREQIVIGRMMKTHIQNAMRAALVITGLLLLIACGQSQASLSAPCSLLSTQEVTTHLGTTITTAHPQTDNPKYSICLYDTPKVNTAAPSPMVIVQINPQPVTAEGFRSSFAAAKVTFESIAGVGDAAFYAPAKNATDGTLFVIKGNHTLSVAIIDSPQDRLATQHTTQALAQLALSRYH